uniref:Uncharacterized protein n=1 Tax=Chromera velia CCMP2878 TaxID=1169474 RepID=A0A0G4FJ03_9ALVE|eukprot:Cvel_17187.t1-p1 / transcript=Cvel_17187.t1 / gene=Cvel_17187 / organism=Chromera_velia_CCMP2878 / gene_product=hypothetical protein / transcript_product=hypothetical protein / location=Cvel_scaffold1358:2250-2997(+) / protein_length=87 / sequence_SO=supercontig / SO=protein_coding / is_pseudo=false
MSHSSPHIRQRREEEEQRGGRGAGIAGRTLCGEETKTVQIDGGNRRHAQRFTGDKLTKDFVLEESVCDCPKGGRDDDDAPLSSADEL